MLTVIWTIIQLKCDTVIPSPALLKSPGAKQYLPHTVIRQIAELLESDTLTVLAANDMTIPYDGWIKVSFQLDIDKNKLQVPILVSSDPIIGYNVIEAVINGREAKT